MLRIYDADAVLTISKFLVEEDERDVVEQRVDVSVRVAKLAFYRLQSEEIRRRFRLVGLYTPLPGVLLPSQGPKSDRSDERRVGTECGRTGGPRGGAVHKKQ